jgi:hypothetical protein
MTQNYLTIDFETYYDKKTYSLSKQTTEAYIRSPEFEVIGVSVQFNDEEPEFFEMLGVRSAPSLLKMTGLINGYKHYKVVAVGLPDIQKYMNNNFNENEEEE